MTKFSNKTIWIIVGVIVAIIIAVAVIALFMVAGKSNTTVVVEKPAAVGSRAKIGSAINQSVRASPTKGGMPQANKAFPSRVGRQVTFQ